MVNKRFLCGRFELDLKRPKIMGIVNVTPDSFSDGGDYNQIDQAISHAHQLIEEGVDILDIGGESTRPGSDEVQVQEELTRVLPLIEELKKSGVPLSLDTRKAAVMETALQYGGVDLINDVYALQDKGAVEILANSPTCGICIMHMYGKPKTMQVAPPDYQGQVTQKVITFLKHRLTTLYNAGISQQRVLIDPGFGFGKTLSQNYQLLNELASFKELKVPLLVGMSRKSMIGGVTKDKVNDRLAGSIAAALSALERGASILRVHDVKATYQAVKVWEAIHFGVEDDA